MHDHDLDLVMALAEGTLEASEVAAAEADIASCEECTRELELQRTALSMLASAPPVGLTEMESARIRRSLRDELGLEAATATTTVVAATRRRRFSWGGALGAAAVLILVLAVAPTLNLLGGSDDSADFAAVTTTQAAAEDTATANIAEGGGEQLSEAGTDDLAGATADSDLPAESGEETTTTGAAALQSPVTARVIEPGTSLDVIDEALTENWSETPAQFYTAAPEQDGGSAEADYFSCVDTGIAELGVGVTADQLVGTTEIDGEMAMVIAYLTESGDVVVQAHDVDTCEVVASS